MTKRPVNSYDRYHAHVYFDENSVERAAALCQEAGELFGVTVGRVHRKLVGPRPRWVWVLGVWGFFLAYIWDLAAWLG